MENGKRRARRQLSPEEKWEIFLEVTSQEISQARCRAEVRGRRERDHQVRGVGEGRGAGRVRLANPGRPASAEAVELELLRAENDRLSEALKELAVELTLHRGRQHSGFQARSPRA